MKRVYVSLPDGVWDILNRDFKNKMGDSESEVIRNIVISFLSQRGYFVNEKGYEDVEEIKQKLFVEENLIDAVVEALEEKGNITYNDVDKRMKRKIAHLSKQG